MYMQDYNLQHNTTTAELKVNQYENCTKDGLFCLSSELTDRHDFGSSLKQT